MGHEFSPTALAVPQGQQHLRSSSEPAGPYISRLPFDSRRVGAAAVYCSDGRFSEQMDEFLHDGLGLQRYDRVAVPGGGACLAGHAKAIWEEGSVERQLRFLITAHALTKVVLIAHPDCGFYKDIWLNWRTLEQQQAVDLERAAQRIVSWCPNVEVSAYVAMHADGRVRFEECARAKARV